jgi:signal transduction histidine kinase
MNLCINARDAMQGKGTLTLALRSVQDVQRVCASCHQPVTGAFVELAVGDTGPGIAPEILERIFEPFFSTKEVSRGSGMGLAMVHGIVHEYGGHILVDATPNASRCPSASAGTSTDVIRGRTFDYGQEVPARRAVPGPELDFLSRRERC